MDVFADMNNSWFSAIILVPDNYFFSLRVIESGQYHYILINPAIVINMYKLRILKIYTRIYFYPCTQELEPFFPIAVAQLISQITWHMGTCQDPQVPQEKD